MFVNTAPKLTSFLIIQYLCGLYFPLISVNILRSLGKCCSWEGDVWVSEGDIKSMHTYLGITRTKFMQKYVKFDAKENKYGLKAKKDEHKDIHPSEADHCIFLHNNKCVVYKAKPTQVSLFGMQINELDLMINLLVYHVSVLAGYNVEQGNVGG